MDEYVFCKYLGKYINQKSSIYWDDTFHPEDMNKIIDSRVRHYAMNNRLHTVYSKLYDELQPDFKKYWCVYSSVRVQLPPFFKTKKQATLRNIYNSLGTQAIMEMINDMIDYYFRVNPIDMFRSSRCTSIRIMKRIIIINKNEDHRRNIQPSHQFQYSSI